MSSTHFDEQQHQDNAPLLSSTQDYDEQGDEEPQQNMLSKCMNPFLNSIEWLANMCLLAFVMITTYFGGIIVEKLWY